MRNAVAGWKKHEAEIRGNADKNADKMQQCEDKISCKSRQCRSMREKVVRKRWQTQLHQQA
jgi:hypothetical protein